MKISENEKISEKAFNNRITLSAIAILFCLFAMISSAVAFFNCNLRWDFTMQAAVWKVEIEEVNGGPVYSGYICPHTEGEMHEFVIYPSGSATKGFCLIEITDNDGEISEYCTPAFTSPKTVRIQAVAGCKIRFIPRWGAPQNYSVSSVYAGTIYHSFTPPPPQETGDVEMAGSEVAVSEYTGESATGESGSNASVETSAGTATAPESSESSAVTSAPSAESSSPVASTATSVSSGDSSSGNDAE